MKKVSAYFLRFWIKLFQEAPVRQRTRYIINVLAFIMMIGVYQMFQFNITLGECSYYAYPLIFFLIINGFGYNYRLIRIEKDDGNIEELLKQYNFSIIYKFIDSNKDTAEILFYVNDIKEALDKASKELKEEGKLSLEVRKLFDVLMLGDYELQC